MQLLEEQNCRNFLKFSTQAEYQNFGLGKHVMYEQSNHSQISIQTKGSNNNQDKGFTIQTTTDNRMKQATFSWFAFDKLNEQAKKILPFQG